MDRAAARADDEIGSGNRIRERLPGFLPNALYAEEQRNRKRDRQHRQTGGQPAIPQALDRQGKDHYSSLPGSATAEASAMRLRSANSTARSNKGASVAS